MKDKKIKRTERGWPGHFICADRCLFRRNTLLELDNLRIVVSTVGNMVSRLPTPPEEPIEVNTVGSGRYFETTAFHAKLDHGYWDIDVFKEIYFDSEWALDKPWVEGQANDMHENVVDEITTKMLDGERFGK